MRPSTFVGVVARAGGVVGGGGVDLMPASTDPIILILEGNSLTVAIYPEVLLATEYGPTRFTRYNVATAGQVTSQMLSSFAAQITANAVANETFCTFWSLVNDFYLDDTLTARDAVDAMWQWCDQATALGCRVIAITPTPHDYNDVPETPANYESRRQTALTLIRSEWASHCAGVLDIAADPRIGYPGTSLDTTYYNGDGVHLNDTGTQIVNRGIKLCIDALLDGSPVGAPVFEVQPQATSIAVGGTGSLSAIAIGENAGGPSYQWQSSSDNSTWSNISGATAYTLTTPTITADIYFRCQASNRFGTTNSNSVLVQAFVNPTDAGTCLAYFDAASGTFQEHNSQTTAAGNTQNVGTWVSSIGSAKLQAVATDASRPTLQTGIVNGLPVIRFDGDVDVIKASESLSTRSYFVVLKYRSATWAKSYAGMVTPTLNSQSVKALIGNTEGDTRIYNETLASGTIVRRNGVSSTMPATVTGPMDEFAIFIIKESSASDYVWQLGQDREVGNNRAALMDVAEIAFYSDNLSISDCELLEQYAANKYGITI